MVKVLTKAVKPESPALRQPKMPAMDRKDAPTDVASGSEHRRRLMQGMGSVAATKGLATATIADVVREAGVSKRTFYEHFDSKESCFLALYRAVSASALSTLKAAVVPGRSWQQQLELALRAYLSHMAGSPELLRTLFIEIQHLGTSGAQARRAVMTELAGFLVDTVRSDGGRDDRTGIDASLALAAVGGINELILQAIEEGRVERLPDMTASAAEVVRRLARPFEP